MKTTQIIFIMLIVISMHANSQIINPGFENWATGPGGFLDPVGWTTSNNWHGLAVVEPGNGHTGTNSARVDYIAQVPFYSSGSLEFNSGPTNLKPVTLTGWWKDQNHVFGCSMAIWFNVYDSNGDHMGSVDIYSSNFATPNWSPFTGTVNYFNNNPVGYYTIYIHTGVANVSYYGFFDDLALTTTTTSVNDNEPVLGSYFSVSGGIPSLHINLEREVNATIAIHDISGRLISNSSVQMNAGTQTYPVTSSDLSNGIYICHIIGDNLNLTQKFQVRN